MELQRQAGDPSEIRRIQLQPTPSGWRLAAPGEFEPMLFLSAAEAEAQARVLAARLAEAGLDVRVEVYDERGAMVSTFCCFSEGLAA
jgi:hypothetical protein